MSDMRCFFSGCVHSLLMSPQSQHVFRNATPCCSGCLVDGCLHNGWMKLPSFEPAGHSGTSSLSPGCAQGRIQPGGVCCFFSLGLSRASVFLSFFRSFFLCECVPCASTFSACRHPSVRQLYDEGFPGDFPNNLKLSKKYSKIIHAHYS